MKAIARPLILTALLLSGCSTLTTTTINNAVQKTNEEGLNYFLPAGVVQVVGIWDQNSGLWDFTATPIIVPDIFAHEYNLKLDRNPFTDNTTGFQINPNPLTPLLQSVNVATTDQSLNSMVSVGSAVGAVLSAANSAVGPAAKSLMASASYYKAHKTSQTNDTVIENFVNTLQSIQTNNYGKLSAIDQVYLSRIKELIPGLINVTSNEMDFATNAVALPPFDYVKSNASFSSFQSFLVAAITNVLEQSSSQSIALPNYHHSAFVLSPIVNGMATYGQFDMSLIAQTDVSKSSFPSGSTDSAGVTNFVGVLVRDPIPYTLIITGNVWLTSWTNLTGLFAQSSSGGQSNAPQQQYSWTYNFPTNYLAYSNVFVLGPKQYVAYQQTIYLPDVSHTRLINIPRRALVADTTSLTMVNGMVVNRQEVRPSAALAWFGIPKTIITALLPIPGVGGGSGSGGGSSAGNSSSGGSAGGTGAASGGGGGNPNGGTSQGQQTGGSQGGAQQGPSSSTTAPQYAPIQ